MTPIEKQILKNQSIMMKNIDNEGIYAEDEDELKNCMKDTKEILNPIKDKEPCSEMPKEEISSKRKGFAKDPEFCIGEEDAIQNQEVKK